MLVSEIGEIVGSIDIVPKELLWKSLKMLERLSNKAWLWLVRCLSARHVWIDELKCSVTSGDAGNGHDSNRFHIN